MYSFCSVDKRNCQPRKPRNNCSRHHSSVLSMSCRYCTSATNLYHPNKKPALRNAVLARNILEIRCNNAIYNKQHYQWEDYPQIPFHPIVNANFSFYTGIRF